jgi:hypothetical protein
MGRGEGEKTKGEGRRRWRSDKDIRGREEKEKMLLWWKRNGSRDERLEGEKERGRKGKDGSRGAIPISTPSISSAMPSLIFTTFAVY